jgi:hypothetical protein
VLHIDRKDQMTYLRDIHVPSLPFTVNLLRSLTIGICLTVVLQIFGCQTMTINTFEAMKGMSEEQVICNIGQPDIIEETSGDQSRYYRPGDQIIYKYKWPETSTKTFFYLNRYLAITIVHDSVETINPISEEKWGTLGLVLRTEQQMNDNMEKLPKP